MKLCGGPFLCGPEVIWRIWEEYGRTLRICQLNERDTRISVVTAEYRGISSLFQIIDRSTL